MALSFSVIRSLVGLSSDFPPPLVVAGWHPYCCIITSRSFSVRRGIYILLAIFLVQLSGLSVLCLPSQGQAHACCPVSTKAPQPRSSHLPECCLGSILNYQGSITETRGADRPSEYTAQSTSLSVPLAAVIIAANAPLHQLVLPSISPPQSPLSQSSLLRI